MTWRAMNSLLVLRDQVNALAPNRSKASDGLIGDATHQAEQSDHNPHYVAGVGSDIVTALDLTHDPANGFDSYLFAEVLRLHRDKRIKYVISNYRIFSSYSNSSRAAWTWGTYSGTDPHTNHVHISVLDDPISDTTTPWNLEGFDDMEQNDVLAAKTDNPSRTVGDVFGDLENVRNWLVAAETAAAGPGAPPASSREGLLHARVKATAADVAGLKADVAGLKATLDQILAKLPQGGNSFTFPVSGTITTAPVTGSIVWNPPAE